MERKLTKTVNYGPFSKSFAYSYYGNGLKHTFTSPDNTVYTYHYGTNNELREVQIPGLGSVSIPDYTWNRPATINYPGGTQRTYTYDVLMRLQSLTVFDPSSNPLLSYQYSYDEVGNIVTKNTGHGNYTYGYNDVSRLLSADNPVLDDKTYTYDKVGNRLTASGTTGTWSYNTNNELLGYTDVEYEYDTNGNMTQKRVGTAAVNYIYNAANRLMEVEDDATQTVIAEYSYDPFGRRLWKDVGGTKTYFFYSEEGLIGQYDVNGTEIRMYGYTPDSAWATAPLFQRVETTYYWYQNDHLGTPQKLIDINGNVVWEAMYDSFGKAQILVNTVDNHVSFPGQYSDSETGLLYNGLRYYDPKTGRYLRTDPIGFGGGMNVYPYVNSNPLQFLDPLGLLEGDMRNRYGGGLWPSPDMWPPTPGSGYQGHPVVDPMKGAGAGIQWFVNGKIVTKLKGYELYISGSVNPLSPPKPTTSVLYVWRKGNVDSNLLRLDLHGLKGYEGNQWHWNRNELEILRKIELDVPDHIPTKGSRFAGKTLRVVRYAGKVFLIVGMASSAYEIYAAEDRMKEVVRQAGGWAGSAGGAWAGGKGGAWAGGIVCSWTGVGVGPCVITGGIIGSISGGIVGWWGGSTTTEFVYEKWFTPLEIEEYVISDCQDDEHAGAEF